MLGMTMTFTVTIAYAQNGSTTTTQVALPTANELLPTYGEAGTGSKVGYVTSLANKTQGDWPQILGNVIKFILAITGTLAFISFTFGGVLMVTAQGKEEQIKKGKEVLIWSILALAVIATSYAIVLGITQLEFTNVQ